MWGLLVNSQYGFDFQDLISLYKGSRQPVHRCEPAISPDDVEDKSNFSGNEESEPTDSAQSGTPCRNAAAGSRLDNGVSTLKFCIFTTGHERASLSPCQACSS